MLHVEIDKIAYMLAFEKATECFAGHRMQFAIMFHAALQRTDAIGLRYRLNAYLHVNRYFVDWI